MGRRGRKPKPTQLKVLAGTLKPHRTNHHEPKPIMGAPPKPGDLGPIASAKWDELVGWLDQMGILAQCDTDILDVYCRTWEAYKEAVKNVSKTGQVLVMKVHPKGGKELTEVKRNPFSTELHKYRDSLQRLWPELGLTASSRSRIVSPTANTDDPLADIQAM